METPKVRLSNIDRGIGIFTAVNSYQSRKLNEHILDQQYKNNRHLSDLKKQMNEANAINRQILANQLREEEHKESQKYYKALSFNLNETIDLISNINDDMVLNYVLSNYYNKLLSNINEANDFLDEISDKTYTKNCLEKLKALKLRADTSATLFQTNILSKIDNLISDFKKEEDMLTQMEPPQLKEPLIFSRDKANGTRTIGIVVLGVFCFVFSIPMVTAIGSKDFNLLFGSLFWILIFGIPLIILIRKERKWRESYAEFNNSMEQKREQFQRDKLQLEQEYQENITLQKNNLLNHTLYNAMQKISEEHPTFDQSLSSIVELESIFESKWNYRN